MQVATSPVAVAAGAEPFKSVGGALTVPARIIAPAGQNCRVSRYNNCSGTKVGAATVFYSSLIDRGEQTACMQATGAVLNNTTSGPRNFPLQHAAAPALQPRPHTRWHPHGDGRSSRARRQDLQRHHSSTGDQAQRARTRGERCQHTHAWRSVPALPASWCDTCIGTCYVILMWTVMSCRMHVNFLSHKLIASETPAWCSHHILGWIQGNRGIVSSR